MSIKLSIITINRNNADGLRKTLESVFAQTYRDFEYIVVDGASSDDSVEVIRASALQAEGLDFKWISEPDTGIYNAMNKGLKMAHGEYTLMLNSGDYLVDEHVIGRIMPELGDMDIIQGNLVMERNGKNFINHGYGKSEITYFDIMRGRFLHQASFCRKKLFEQYDYFDETYKMIADTKFFMMMLGRYNASFKYVDITIAMYDCTGISESLDVEWQSTNVRERKRLLRELYPERLLHQMYSSAKKIELYDKLRMHRWAWFLTMIIIRICDILYNKNN